jgi:outer membrane protein OmpA-like peptidoglycan-associated protein
MRKNLVMVIVLSAMMALGFAQRVMKDHPGTKDPALFTRLPNFYLLSALSVIEKQFDAYEFHVRGEKGVERKRVEGHFVTYKYVFDKSSGPSPSGLQIMRNYQSAAATLGGKTLHEDRYRTTVLISKDGNETWIEVSPVVAGYEYTLRILERKAMEQDVLANAAVFQTGLAQNGHVEVPGIFFDTAKSDLKPESETALKEVAKLLQDNASLKVWVVGHTDNTGQDEANVVLSQARAASVVKALLQMGVAATRLAPHGAGPFAPVAPNTAEEGRARNRRVELVARQ